jgi:hypothetical protein
MGEMKTEKQEMKKLLKSKKEGYSERFRISFRLNMRNRRMLTTRYNIGEKI